MNTELVDLIIKAALILLLGIAAVILVNMPKRKTLFAYGIFLALLVFLVTALWFPHIATAIQITAIVVTAGIAILAISLNRQQREDAIKREERDRRGQLLNEITNWLRGLESRIFPSSGRLTREILEGIALKKKAGVSLEMVRSVSNLDENLMRIDLLNSEIKEIEYMQKIACKLDSDLGGLIGVILDLLKGRKELITESSRYPTPTPPSDEEEMLRIDTLLNELTEDKTKSLEGVELSESYKATIQLGRNAGEIKKSILDAIDKAIDIKMSLLNL